MDTKKTALLTLVIASFFWASSGVAVKTLLTVTDPIIVGLLRLSVAAILITPLAYRRVLPITRTKLLDILPAASLSALNFLLFLFAMKYTTANASAIIYAGTPITVAVLSHFFIGERLTRQKSIGILVGFIGILSILILPLLRGTHTSSGSAFGNFLLVCAMIVFSLYNITTRRLTAHRKYDSLTIVSIAFYTSALMFFCLTCVFPHDTSIQTLLNPKYLLTALYLGFFVTIVPFTLHQWTIKHSSATTGALTTYIQPIFGILFNAYFLKETLSAGFFAGAALVFTGSLLTGGQSLLKIFKKDI